MRFKLKQPSRSCSKQDRDVGVARNEGDQKMGTISAKFKGDTLSEEGKGQKRVLGEDSDDDEVSAHMNSPQRYANWSGYCVLVLLCAHPWRGLTLTPRLRGLTVTMLPLLVLLLDCRTVSVYDRIRAISVSH